MPRSEFSRKTRARVFARAAGRCEGCGAKLKVREGEYDHVLPCALGGEATEDNCKLLCRVCHSKKTADDIRQTRKADRQRDAHTGAKRTSRPIPGSKRSGWKHKMDGTWERR